MENSMQVVTDEGYEFDDYDYEDGDNMEIAIKDIKTNIPRNPWDVEYDDIHTCAWEKEKVYLLDILNKHGKLNIFYRHEENICHVEDMKAELLRTLRGEPEPVINDDDFIALFGESDYEKKDSNDSEDDEYEWLCEPNGPTPEELLAWQKQSRNWWDKTFMEDYEGYKAAKRAMGIPNTPWRFDN